MAKVHAAVSADWLWRYPPVPCFSSLSRLLQRNWIRTFLIQSFFILSVILVARFLAVFPLSISHAFGRVSFRASLCRRICRRGHFTPFYQRDKILQCWRRSGLLQRYGILCLHWDLIARNWLPTQSLWPIWEWNSMSTRCWAYAHLRC